jgi:hypothetical protein
VNLDTLFDQDPLAFLLYARIQQKGGSADLNVTSIAKNLGIDRSRVHRAIKLLASNELCTRQDDGSYRSLPPRDRAVAPAPAVVTTPLNTTPIAPPQRLNPIIKPEFPSGHVDPVVIALMHSYFKKVKRGGRQDHTIDAIEAALRLGWTAPRIQSCIDAYAQAMRDQEERYRKHSQYFFASERPGVPPYFAQYEPRAAAVTSGVDADMLLIRKRRAEADAARGHS